MTRHFAFAWAVAGVSMGCGPTELQRAANVAEAAQYAAELTECRQQGHAVKADGGDGLAAYEACACKVDARHGVDGGCP